MSHLSNLLGPIDEPPNHVMFRGYTLCRACSRALHAQHEQANCQCDLCEKENS